MMDRFLHITKTYLYNFDPLKPHLYIVKLGFTGVYIILLISAQKHRLWILVRTAITHNLCFEQKCEKIYKNFYLKKVSVFGGEFFNIAELACFRNDVWSFHMKFIKLAEGSFRKFHTKWPLM